MKGTRAGVLRQTNSLACSPFTLFTTLSHSKDISSMVSALDMRSLQIKLTLSQGTQDLHAG